MLVLVDEVSDDVGGAERFAVGAALALPRDEFDVTVCATRRTGGRLVAELDAAGVSHFALERRSSFDLGSFRALYRHLRERRVQVLHSHKIGSNLWGTLFGRLARVPVLVAHEHTWSYEGQPLRKLADGLFIGRLCSAFVAVSNADRERMIRLEHVPAEKALAIPTAFVPRASEPAFDLRAELGIPAAAPVVGTMAQLRPQKALEVLIEAFTQVAAKRPDAHLVIAGDGPCRPELEQAARDRGVSDHVHFPGLQTNLDAVLGAFDIAAMSSDFEGMPLFVFECMKHHTPLVATEVGGIPDIVEDGKTGLLVQPRDAAALAEAIGRLIDSPELAAQISDAAAKQLGEFTMERAGERFAELYRRLLERSGR